MGRHPLNIMFHDNKLPATECQERLPFPKSDGALLPADLDLSVESKMLDFVDLCLKKNIDFLNIT